MTWDETFGAQAERDLRAALTEATGLMVGYIRSGKPETLDALDLCLDRVVAARRTAARATYEPAASPAAL